MIAVKDLRNDGSQQEVAIGDLPGFLSSALSLDQD